LKLFARKQNPSVIIELNWPAGEIIRALNRINYSGPLSVEWEDPVMDREHGATEACEFVKELDFPPSSQAFDDAFRKD